MKKQDLTLQYILVYTIRDNMFLAYTCIYKYKKYIQSYTTIYLYILQYTSMIIPIQGVRIPFLSRARASLKFCQWPEHVSHTSAEC